MNKVFIFTGITTILIVAIFILTCPKEQGFQQYIEKEYGIVCSEQSFQCLENESEPLEFVESQVRNSVFFMTIEKTFQTKSGEYKSIRSIGFLNHFWNTTIIIHQA
ncbi:MAG: hypothetical protein ACE3JP_15120 [Ectobacillus sp.]